MEYPNQNVQNATLIWQMNLNYQLKITCVEEDKYNWEMTTEDKKEGDHGPDGHVVWQGADCKYWEDWKMAVKIILH